MIKPKVLFLCSDNSCRTQMAEAFLRDVAGDRFEAVSEEIIPPSCRARAADWACLAAGRTARHSHTLRSASSTFASAGH